MGWQEVRKKAKEKLKGYCRVCPQCNGQACSGEVPGMGGSGTGRTFRDNYNALGEIFLNMRTIHDAKEPDTTAQIFGRKLSLPVLAAPMTGVSYNMGGALSESEFSEAIIRGSVMAGTIGMAGDGVDFEMYASGIDAIQAVGGKGIPIFKPRSQKEIPEYISRAEEAGAVSVGMDIDGAGLVTMAMHGQPVGPKTVEELQEIIQSTRLPFILKGIMTPDEAGKAAEAGAAGIVVSNHGGRCLDSTPGVARVLADVVTAVRGRMVVFADGGVRSGVDVLKYLALGADAVLVGRPLAVAACGGQAMGVKEYLEMLRAQLFQAMILTGCASVSEIDDRVIAKVGPRVVFGPRSPKRHIVC